MTANSQHTPGPWRVVQRGPIVSIIDAQEDAPNGGDHPIGDIFALYRGLPRTKETVLANARLIAAAPDLLEALEDILFQSEQPIWHAVGGSVDEATMEDLRAAIAKARGAND